MNENSLHPGEIKEDDSSYDFSMENWKDRTEFKIKKKKKWIF